MNATRQRVALVTGSSSGIGAAVAKELTRSCAAVIGLDRPGADHSDLAKACDASGARFHAIASDIADELSVAEAFAEADQLGRLDIVVNSAGVSAPSDRPRATETMTLADWQRVIDVNLTGAFLVCRAAIPRLKRNGWGRIVTIGSQTARLPSREAGSAYSSSKAGVRMFTQVLALELAPFGITVNCVAPGLTRTRMTAAWDLARYAAGVPLGRVGEPEDLSGVVSFVVSDAASYITGATIDVNGGTFMA